VHLRTFISTEEEHDGHEGEDRGAAAPKSIRELDRAPTTSLKGKKAKKTSRGK
jgi:hypothetical protein